jgi:uncharacterized protein Usg
MLDAYYTKSLLRLKSPQIVSRNFIHIDHVANYIKLRSNQDFKTSHTAINVGSLYPLKLTCLVDFFEFILEERFEKVYENITDSEIVISNPDHSQFLNFYNESIALANTFQDLVKYISVWKTVYEAENSEFLNLIDRQ